MRLKLLLSKFQLFGLIQTGQVDLAFFILTISIFHPDNKQTEVGFTLPGYRSVGYYENQARVSEMLLHSKITIPGYNASADRSLDHLTAEEANHMLASCASTSTELF